MFPVLDWDPKQWLIVLSDHPSIPRALQHMRISIGGFLVLSCEIFYVPDSQTKVEEIVLKRRTAFSHGNPRAMSLSTREWSIRAGERAISYTSDVGNLETSLCVPDSDVGILNMQRQVSTHNQLSTRRPVTDPVHV